MYIYIHISIKGFAFTYNIFYLTLYTFSFEINESRLSDTRCLIQDVIKEWRDVTQDVLCRTTLT
jgi:hypothetical protein